MILVCIEVTLAASFKGENMYKFQQVRVVRSLALASLGAVVVAGLAGVELAGASPEHHAANQTHVQGTWSNFGGHEGHEHGHGRFGLHGVVTAVTATSVTITSEHGTAVVLTITPTTLFTVGGTSATVSSLAVGENVKVAVDPTSPSTATLINIAAPRGVHGQVTAVTATSVTITSEHGTPVVLTITPTTTFSVGSTTATAASLAVGDRVSATLDPTAPTTATQISITMPEGVHGQVTAVTATSVTIASEHGTPVVVTITPTTTFSEGSVSATIAALAVGERVEVKLSPTVPNTATQINIQLMRVEGLVSAVNATTLTLAKGEGWTFSVTLSPTTTFSSGGTATTISSVTAGTRVEVQGIMSADHTTINAVNVAVLNSNSGGNSHSNRHMNFNWTMNRR